MVVKRSCSFCAGEIEPGTGMMFVKRDGSIFHFCTSSCRKQQLHLGRVGHRLKWTRAHAIKRQTEQSSAAGKAAAAAQRVAPSRSASRPAALREPAKEPAKSPAEPGTAPSPSASPAPKDDDAKPAAASPPPASPDAPAPKKPRAKKPKDATDAAPPA
jgi:large subunit ribosomal protein L24e